MSLATGNDSLPTLYEHYTAGGINSGLSVENPYFTLNDKNITLYSGTFHYFRVPKQNWRSTLRKMRAAGLNSVETYVPWNLHEPQPGVYDFGNGGTDMQDFLDVQEFLKIAQEEDLFAIVRPGPYICAEWEFGGLPSWLLSNSETKIRTSEPTYMSYVREYFSVLLPLLAALQFINGGPIIALQIENEYGSTATSTWSPDKEYLKQLRQLYIDNGIKGLLFTSDGAGSGAIGTLPDELFMTVNFASNPESQFDALKKSQPNTPTMAMEYWTGWFDHWTEPHHVRNNADFKDVLERILKYPASVNMYMFIGGSSFGFVNGANVGSGTDNSQYQPDTTSYDYDAPLSEAGDYTEKYEIVKELIEKYNTVPTRLPERPALVPRVKYPSLQIKEQILLSEVLDNFKDVIQSESLLPMELLPINNNSGQNFGYIVYRKTLDIKANSTLTIGGHICDTVLVLVNGQLISTNTDDVDGFGFWRLKDSSITLSTEDLENATLDLVVENFGRVNFGSLNQFNQYKGLWQGNVTVDGEVLQDWKIIPLEFKRKWNNNLTGWHDVSSTQATAALYKVEFKIETVADTFIDMQEWTKGITIVNGFVLGRHFHLGPQQALYLPAQFLKSGTNSIVVFEHYNAPAEIKFSTDPIFKNN